MFIELTKLHGERVIVNYLRIDNIQWDFDYIDEERDKRQYYTIVNQHNCFLRVRETPEEIMKQIRSFEEKES